LNDLLALVRIRRKIFEKHRELVRKFNAPGININEWIRFLLYLETRGSLGVEDGKLVQFAERRGETVKVGEVDIGELIRVIRDYRKVNSRIYRELRDITEELAFNYDKAVPLIDRLTLTTEKPKLQPAIEELAKRWGC